MKISSRKNISKNNNKSKKNKINKLKGGVLPDHMVNNIKRLSENDINLTKLNFAHSYMIDDENAVIIAAALKTNTHLTELNISNNRIGNIGANALAEALKINKHLKILNINSNNIEEEGVVSLVEALKKINHY
jgi:hypothetical protein